MQIKAHTPNPTFLLILQKLFYWSSATPFHLYIIYGCFGTTTSELRTTLSQKSKYLPSATLQKKSADSWFKRQC